MDINDGSNFNEFVFEKLVDWRRLGLKTALLTLVNIEGSSPRPVGSQLAVNERGQYTGLISGGCLEVALVAEACICIEQALVRCIRFGKDSDYFDIQLPCGSGVDILIQPIASDEAWPEAILQHYLSRAPIEWTFNMQTSQSNVRLSECAIRASENLDLDKQLSRQQMDMSFQRFRRSFMPRHRIVVLGEGEVFESFLGLSKSFDFELFAFSGKAGVKKGCRLIEEWDARLLDKWSSLVVLSHDHTWEHAVLSKALRTEVSFITALGSKKTHFKRLQGLADEGFEQSQLLLVKGPAGLDIGGQSPPEISLSILCEIVAKKNLKSV